MEACIIRLQLFFCRPSPYFLARFGRQTSFQLGDFASMLTLWQDIIIGVSIPVLQDSYGGRTGHHLKFHARVAGLLSMCVEDFFLHLWMVMLRPNGPLWACSLCEQPWLFDLCTGTRLTQPASPKHNMEEHCTKSPTSSDAGASFLLQCLAWSCGLD